MFTSYFVGASDSHVSQLSLSFCLRKSSDSSLMVCRSGAFPNRMPILDSVNRAGTVETLCGA